MITDFKKGDVIKLKSFAVQNKEEEQILKLIVERKRNYYIWRYYPLEDFKNIDFDSRNYSDPQFEFWELNK